MNFQVMKLKENSKARNLVFLVIELVLVLSVSAGSIAMVLNNSSQATIGGVSVTDDSSTGSSTSSSTTSNSTASTSAASSSESTTSSSGSVNTVTKSTNSIPSTLGDVISDNITDPCGMWDSNGVLNWNEDQFFPQMQTPSEVLDYIALDDISNDETLMFTSLKGIVNRTQPRIYTCNSDPSEEYDTWAEELNLKFNQVDDPYSLITKYRDELNGIIIYDDSTQNVIDTINLATTMAGYEHAIIMSPALYESEKMQTLINELGLVVVSDLRNQFTNKWDIYNYMYDNYASKTTDRILVGISASTVYGSVRDYAIAVGAPVVYLDPSSSKDAAILDKFLGRMPDGESSYMGWWPSEGDGVTYACGYGVVTVASDWSVNLSVYAGIKEDIIEPPAASDITLENKAYVAFVLSDGDNMQYCEGRLESIWSDPLRGTIPMTYTISPAMKDLMPANLNYYYETATENDCFISGPSAFGYFYPQFWDKLRYADNAEKFLEHAELKSFLARSDKYMEAMSLSCITVWNNTTAMRDTYLQMYADCMPSLSGITQQEPMTFTENGVALYNGDFLVKQMTMSYASELYQFQSMADQIVTAYQSDSSKPTFSVLQGVSWGTMGVFRNYVDIADYMKLLEPNVEFVRMDQLLELEKEYLATGGDQ